jgi:TonB family protein
MVPPEEIELNAPTTLPADFGEWDNLESPAPQPPANTGRFDGFPGSVAVSKPMNKAVTARVAVLPVASRAPSPAPRRPAPVYAEAEKVIQQPKHQAAKAASTDQKPEGKKKTGLFVGLGAAAILLIAGGGFGYLRLRPGMTAKPSLASQAALNSSTAIKPTPSSPTSADSTAKETAAAAADTTETARPNGASSDMMNHQLNAPSRISSDLKTLSGKDAPPAAGFGAADLGGGANPGGGVFGAKTNPNVKVAAPQKVSISAGIAVGLLMQKTAPTYPPIAKTARVQGTVVIQATISKNGSIQSPHVVSGPVMLRQAALDAVKTWRFRPYMLSGEPVDVETTVNVNFALGG